MNKQKLGKKADDIFARKPPEEQEKINLQPQEDPVVESSVTIEPKAKLDRGRPLELKEEWSKVTVVLLNRHIHWLDQLSTEIRWKTKASVSRAEILRAMISAVEESRIDLSGIKSEAEIKNKILQSLSS